PPRGEYIMDDGILVSDTRDAGPTRTPRPTVNLDLSVLSPEERLWLWRINEPSSNPAKPGPGGKSQGGHLSQVEAMALTGWPRAFYCAAERCSEDVERVNAFLATVAEPPLTRALQSRLARRRTGFSLEVCSYGVGCLSVPTFLKQERAGAE